MTFSNIMSYGDNVTIDFNHTGVTQLIGNNGVGKSSIAVILEECLYNKNSKGIPKGELVHRYRDVKGYSITVKFSDAQHEYQVDKKVTASAKVKLFRDGEDISGHTATQTYKLIEAIIGTDFNTFTKLINQSMASSLDFLSATDANRKKFLIELIGLDQYAKIEGAAKLELKEVKNKLSEITGKKTYLEEELTKSRVKAAQDEMPVHDPVDYSDTLTDLMMEIKTVEQDKADIVQVNNRIKVRNSLIAELEKIERTEPHKPDTLTKIDSKDTTNRIAEITMEVRNLTAEIVKLQNVKTECFTCKRPFEDVPDMSAEIESCKKSISDLNEEKEVLNRQLFADQSFNKEIDQWLGYKESRDRVLRQLDGDTQRQDAKSLDSFDARILELREEINKLKKEQTERKESFDRATEHNTMVVLSRARCAELEGELANCNDPGLLDRESNLTTVKDTFSTKGLVAYKIESSIKVFEKLINEYLAELSQGQFALSFAVTESKLEVIIYDGEHRINIKSVSSGELNKINMATLLAVRKLMSAVSKVNINLLFIDEVSSVLDGASRDELTELLLKETHLNSLMVTHEYTHPLTHKLHIFKENKVARIENGN